MPELFDEEELEEAAPVEEAVEEAKPVEKEEPQPVPKGAGGVYVKRNGKLFRAG